MNVEEYFNRIYADYDRWFIIPVLLFVLSLAVIGGQYAANGNVVDRGVVFSGGTEVTYNIQEEFDTVQIEEIFASQGRPGTSALREETESGPILRVTVPPPQLENESVAESFLENNSIKNFNVDVQQFYFATSAVAETFFIQAVWAFILAFTIMSLVIFTSFRDLVPAFAVVLAASADIIFTIAAMSLLDIPMTLGSLSALLMLIGYSVDTDIVLSSRVLKQKRGSLRDRIWSSVKTGVTMSSGGIAAFTLLYFISMALVGPSELSAVASVMVIGLLADMPFTWFGNAFILKKYVEGDFNVPDLREVIPWP
ncbi:hypothetical protein ACK3SF_05780 [Candidatus Nanosalina sp. VS9-1]|uniref:hypothetical protein n=1 Tax=Candidatus Nanosalina sp. VS9-1 TaxID=3388566 RepID=UPI0039E1BA63